MLWIVGRGILTQRNFIPLLILPPKPQLNHILPLQRRTPKCPWPKISFDFHYLKMSIYHQHINRKKDEEHMQVNFCLKLKYHNKIALGLEHQAQGLGGSACTDLFLFRDNTLFGFVQDHSVTFSQIKIIHK